MKKTVKVILSCDDLNTVVRSILRNSGISIPNGTTLKFKWLEPDVSSDYERISVEWDE